LLDRHAGLAQRVRTCVDETHATETTLPILTMRHGVVTHGLANREKMLTPIGRRICAACLRGADAERAEEELAAALLAFASVGATQD
jgi:hypothetical protein